MTVTFAKGLNARTFSNMEIINIRAAFQEIVEEGPEIGQVFQEGQKEDAKKKKRDQASKLSTKKRKRDTRNASTVTDAEVSELKKECSLANQFNVYDAGTLHDIDRSKETLTLTKETFEWKGKLDSLSDEIFPKIYDHASPAGYGNRKSGKTELDEKVRKAKEFGTAEFRLSSSFQQAVDRVWKNSRVLYPKEVKIEPYKVNIYKKGDHFSAHLDTPEPNLLATLVVCLYTSYHPGIALIVNGLEWSPHVLHYYGSLEWCGFYSDIPHEVPVSTADCRVVVTFKVFADKNMLSERKRLTQISSDETKERIYKMVNHWRIPVGFLLSHQYPLVQSVHALKGVDAWLLEALQHIPQSRIFFLCVSVEKKTHASNPEDPSDSESEKEGGVWYTVGTIPVRHVLLQELKKISPLDLDEKLYQEDEKASQAMSKHPSIDFFKWHNGFVWKNDEEVESTGNTGDYGNINNIYLHRALVVLPL